MKKIFILIVSVMALQAATAQDQAIFSHYNINPILINPATAGFFNEHQLMFNSRLQWTGFPDAPQTYQVQYNGPIGRTFGLGVGVLSENAAQISRTRAFLNAAFRFDIGDNVKLTLGFSNEFQNMRVDSEVLSEGSFYQAGDEIVERAVDGINIYDASLGGYATIKENTYIGLTFTNLVRAQLDDIAGGSTDEGGILQYYIFNLGHQFYIDNLDFMLEPSLALRQIRDVPFQTDFNLKGAFFLEKPNGSQFERDQLITGVSYRTLGAMGVMLGIKTTAGPNNAKFFKSFQVIYSYDVSFQRFQKYNSGSHEITVGLNL